ncbi:MAG: hypothetical protein ACOH5I_10275 [Oligoflexus sp.]
MKLKTSLALCCAFVLTACVPDVYLIDRQTVLETQASGEWPELDRIFYEKAVSSGPVPLEKTADRHEARKLFQMTHSDLKQDKSAGVAQ